MSNENTRGSLSRRDFLTAAELGADVICVEALGLHGGNAQSAGMCGILGGYSGQNKKHFAFPSYPFDPQALTDWAMDEYHYAADPKLIYRIASEGGKSLDWMADCGVRWRLGEVPVYVAPKNATLDHHVLKMKDATDAMFAFGQKRGVRYKFQCPAAALVRDETGRIVGLVAKEDFDREVYRPCQGGRGAHGRRLAATTRRCWRSTSPRRPWAARQATWWAERRANASAWAWAWAPTCRASTARPASTAAWTGRPKAGSGRAFLYDGMTQLSRQPWLTIDRCGNRLRYMDSRVGEDGANAIYALGDLATIQMTPPGHRSYIIFDTNYEDHLAGFAQEHCRKLITPDLEQIDKVPEHYRDWHHGVQDAIDADVLKRRDTLEELEADLGFAPGVLTEAVAKWNECCERGEDDFMYPMPPEWLHAITTPPFYGCRIGGNLYGHEGRPAHQRPDAGDGRKWPGHPRPVRRLAHRRRRVRRKQLHRRPHSGLAHGRRGPGVLRRIPVRHVRHRARACQRQVGKGAGYEGIYARDGASVRYLVRNGAGGGGAGPRGAGHHGRHRVAVV